MWQWVSEKLYGLFVKHRDQIVLSVTTGFKVVVPGVIGHIAALNFIPTAWVSWAAEPLAFMIVGVVGYIWSRRLQLRRDARHEEKRNQLSIAATRIAVAVAKNVDVSMIPDDVHAKAMIEVRALDQKDGVPVPR